MTKDYKVRYKLETGKFKDGTVHVSLDEFYIAAEGKFKSAFTWLGLAVGMGIVFVVFGGGAIPGAIGGGGGVLLGALVGELLDRLLRTEKKVVFSSALSEIVSVVDGKRKTLEIATVFGKKCVVALGKNDLMELKQTLGHSG